MTLSERFDDALVYAARLHRDQIRKGSGIPYVSHLLAVCALVVEHGGSEDQAIAALLHDAAEDQGGEARLNDIRARYGSAVADIVSDCTDAWTEPKPPWRPRKEQGGLSRRAPVEALHLAARVARRQDPQCRRHPRRLSRPGRRAVGSSHRWSRGNDLVLSVAQRNLRPSHAGRARRAAFADGSSISERCVGGANSNLAPRRTSSRPRQILGAREEGVEALDKRGRTAEARMADRLRFEEIS
jgi:HD domain